MNAVDPSIIAAPLSAREHVLAHLVANPGRCRTSEIAANFEGSTDSVYVALSDLAKRGKIERVSTGVYQIADGTPTAETKPAHGETKRPKRAVKKRAVKKARREPPPTDAEEPEAVESDLLIGAWSSGALTIARGDAEIVLTIEERRKLQTWIEIMDEEAL